jgi:hypothetical protein
MRILLVAIFLIISMAVVFIYTSSSSAQENDGIIGQEANIFPRLFQRNMTCSTSDYVYNDLKDRFQAVKVWWGLTQKNDLAELFLNLNTGRWFLMLSSTDKVTCGLVGGEMSVPYDKNPYFK